MKKQFSKFILVSLINAVINFTVFYLLYKLITIDYTIACVSAFIAAVLSGFIMNKRWTFRCRSNSKKLIIKYFLVYGISLLVSIPLIRFQVEKLGMGPFYANFGVMIFTSILNFIGIKFYIFDRVK